MSRRINLAPPTPIMENTQAHASIPVMEPTSTEGPVFTEPSPQLAEPKVIVKPNDSLRADAVAMGGVDGSAIDDTPVGDESITVASTPVELPAPATFIPTHNHVTDVAPGIPPPIPGMQVAPEVMNVLAALAQYQKQSKQRSSSASSR